MAAAAATTTTTTTTTTTGGSGGRSSDQVSWSRLKLESSNQSSSSSSSSSSSRSRGGAATAAAAAIVGIPGAHAVSPGQYDDDDDDGVMLSRYSNSKDPRARHENRESLKPKRDNDVSSSSSSLGRVKEENFKKQAVAAAVAAAATRGQEVESMGRLPPNKPAGRYIRKKEEEEEDTPTTCVGHDSKKIAQDDLDQVDFDSADAGSQDLTQQLEARTTSVPGAHFIAGIHAGRRLSEFDNDSSSSELWETTVDAAAGGGAPNVDYVTTSTMNARGSMLDQARLDDKNTGNDNDNNDNLAIAVPVDEKKEYDSFVEAKEYNPHEKLKVYQRRSFQAFLALFCLLAIGGAVGGAVAARNRKRNHAIVIIATPAPTAAPTVAPTSIDQPRFRAFLDASMAPNLRDFSPNAYELALGWLADMNHSLNRQPEYDDENDDALLLEQRFVLAWLWYHTTKNGEEPWLSCNPPNASSSSSSSLLGDEDENNNDTCVFQNHTGVSDDGSQVFYQQDNATRWLSNTHECTWPGIYCNETTGVVWAISLRGMNLQGEFPIFLSQLPELSFLELIFNQLVGALPNDFGSSFNGLTFFSVMNNTLSGTVPDSVYSIPNLGYLGLGNNRFSGQLSSPAIANASALVQLYLNGNAFTGDLPDGIGQLSSLQLLHMQRNPGFVGSTIPSSFGNLSQLKILWLFKNGLAGTIPQEFGNLQLLFNLRLQDNQLTGPLPTIPAPDLMAFEAAENLLNGTIPDALYNSTNLQTLSFNKNQITGPLKPAIGNLKSLVYLAIYDNQLTGTIPLALSNLTLLQTIWMHYNQFNGSVPIEICNLRAPEKLSNLTSDCRRPLLSNGGEGDGDGDDEDFNDCYCCTDCCDRVDRDCGPANYDRNGERF
jgi:Leucine-rich repeat (LRR) protein